METRDNQRIITAAVAVLPAIVAALDPKGKPAPGGYVEFTVGEEAGPVTTEQPPIHTRWYKWHFDAPPETLDEATFKRFTRDATTGALNAPSWAYHLAPISADEWYLEYWFQAPLRMWLGDKAGDRVKAEGVSFHARRTAGGWLVTLDDVLAF